MGLNPNDLKLVTAVFVFVALVLTRLRGRRRTLISDEIPATIEAHYV